MTQRPLISIIVPVYNGAETIGRSIASVAAQTYDNIELVIIDDGSDDGTGDAVSNASELFSTLVVRYIRIERQGVSAARNTGLELAKGELIAFLDADDTYLPDAVETLLDIMVSTKAQIALAQYDEMQSMKGTLCCLPEEAVENTLYQRKGFHESPCAKLFAKDIFSGGLRFAVGRRYEDMEICPDTYMSADCIAVCGKKIYNYTKNPDSFINTWTDARLDALWATDSIAAKWGTQFPGACRHRRFSACFNIFNLACANGERKVADDCWKEIRRLRWGIIMGSRSRIRNRLAAIASFTGQRMSSFLIRHLHLYGK